MIKTKWGNADHLGMAPHIKIWKLRKRQAHNKFIM